MTAVLAAYGAFIGTVGAVLAVLNYLRERPQLYIDGENSRDGVMFRVHNHGHRATTVLRVGWLGFEPSREVRPSLGNMMRLSGVEPTLVAPGDTKQWGVPAKEIYDREQKPHGGSIYIWPCVLDARGKVRAGKEPITFGRVIPDD